MTNYLDVLIELARVSLKSNEINISTKFLASRLNVSQQTVSRKLREMEKKNLIKRQFHRRGQKVEILSEGEKILKTVYQRLEKINKNLPSGIHFKGYIIEGSGEGKYYTNLKGYSRQFYKKLKYKPYPGTLNIKLKSVEDLKEKNKLANLPPVIIHGFKTKDRTYGEIHCWPCKINGKVKGTIVIPKRTHHHLDTVEILAPICLRKYLSLKNNNLIKIEVNL